LFLNSFVITYSSEETEEEDRRVGFLPCSLENMTWGQAPRHTGKRVSAGPVPKSHFHPWCQDLLPL